MILIVLLTNFSENVIRLPINPLFLMNYPQIQATTPLPDENQMVRAMGHILR